ncbi:hypothetical protein KM043_003879 [Ampulex compressa]|nr:hypothetical protein KM043_003879 [Ampulex compressa]
MTALPDLSDGWSFEQNLGSGSFGIVQLWIHEQTKEKLAIKICKWENVKLTTAQERRWANEVQIMKRLTHSNIVRVIDVPFRLPGMNEHVPVLCMEYCKKGDLRKDLNRIEHCCGLPEEEAIRAMRDILSAVEYLHSNGITHRDLKPENIVLQGGENAISYKLIDLGYAKDIGEASTSASIVGTLNYVAPELLWKEKYSCSVDYWSMGILFYELITGTRPFFPKTQRTMAWMMQHIKSKEYDDICAYESEGKVIFQKTIQDPTHLSRCVKEKLTEWFKVALQFDPKKRGRRLDDRGVSQLVIFRLLRSMLPAKLFYAFVVPLYKIYTYEADKNISAASLKKLVEKDTGIPVQDQILTDYYGAKFVNEEIPLMSQVEHSALFVFKSGKTLEENAHRPIIPVAVQRMIEQSDCQLDFETLKDYYRMTIFFVQQQIYLFKMFIFALSIKVDLITAQINAFNETIENASSNTKFLVNETRTIKAELEKGRVDERQEKSLHISFEKITKLSSASGQINMRFASLMQESNMLKSTAQRLDGIRDVSVVYDQMEALYARFKTEPGHKGGKPTEMVKLLFEFLRVHEAQHCSDEVVEITRQVSKLEIQLATLERILHSVTAMTAVYRDELKKMSLVDVRKTQDSTQSPSSSVIETIDESLGLNDNVIYDNLVIRYTLKNLLTAMQKNCLEDASLDL